MSVSDSCEHLLSCDVGDVSRNVEMTFLILGYYTYLNINLINPYIISLETQS